MTTTLKRRTRTRKGTDLDEGIENYFLTGKATRDTPAGNLHASRFFDQGAEIGRVWEQHKDYLLKKWKQEGRKRKPWILKGQGREDGA